MRFFIHAHIPLFPKTGHTGSLHAGAIDAGGKEGKSAQSFQIGAKMKEEYLNSCTGTIQSVLFETEKPGTSIGYAGNYCRVQVATPGLGNIIKDVRITGTRNGMLIGTVI